MPKENKNTSRKNRRQCSEVDNEIASDTQDVSKSVFGNNRYSPLVPREASRRESNATKSKMFMPSIEDLHSMSGGIIENGIKYIMFPLHLLRFCIFGTSFTESADSKANTEAERTKSRDKSYKERTEKEERRKEEESLKEEKENNNEESEDEMVTAEEDSDSSVEQWNNARDTMPMNMSVDFDNTEKSMSHVILEEPMDISIEEHGFDKSYSVINISQDSQQSTNVQSNAIESISSKTYADEEYNSSSVDEEIAKIFQKQCTSSEDEFVPSSRPKSHLFRKYEKTEQNDFLHNGGKSNYFAHTPRSKKGFQDDEKQRKKTSTEFVASNKRRKLFQGNKNERQTVRKSENKTKEEKRSARQNSSSKNKLSSSRTPVKSKDTKRRNIKYKEMATQTDSAFSDDDVEMISADTKSPDRSFCSKHTRRSQLHHFQDKQMAQELNYIADNEDSTDGFLRITHKRISSCSTSSSSTDLGFDERASTTPDTDIVVGQWRTNSPDSTSALRARVRAPPGFPEVPQNPPLTSTDPYFCFVKTTAVVPPAPSPMRHLYYDYPEFMDLPIYVQSSQILNNILKNNYYR
ncbi:uncharacterized protein LOC143423818 [Xylocopa sonorina]|uniref:uncharacterized protein LOC143423818 n=1 Tax=Xylocopa sonorina TaxID=1818115 RepID=UPI00403B0FD4